MKGYFKIYCAAIISMIFWSLSFIWFKEANENLHPMTIVFFRLLMAAIIMTLYIFFTKGFVKIKREDRKYFFLMAFCEPFMYFIGESNGLTYISATVGSIIIAVIPVVISLAAWIFLKEKLRLLNYIGIILSFLGIIVFVFNSDGELLYDVKGLVLMLLAVLSAVGYGIFISKIVNSYSPVFIVMVQNIIGVSLFLPVFCLSDLRYVIDNPFTFTDLVPVFKLGLFASIGAFALFSVVIKNMGVTRANVFTNSIPIFTAIFSFFILDESITLQNWIGIAIVVLGLFLSQTKAHDNA